LEARGDGAGAAEKMFTYRAKAAKGKVFKPSERVPGTGKRRAGTKLGREIGDGKRGSQRGKDVKEQGRGA